MNYLVLEIFVFCSLLFFFWGGGAGRKGLFTTSLISLINIWLLRLSISSSVTFHSLYLLRNLTISSNLLKFIGTRLFMIVLGWNSCPLWMISVHFQDKPFNITVIQVYAPISNTEEGEVEWFYEDLQDLLELTPKKHVLFIIGDWNAKVGSQETPGVTGKFGLGIWKEAEQKLIEFCQENTLVIANTLFRQHKRRL